MIKVKYILYACVMALMAGCSAEDSVSDGTLSGKGKTPLNIEATLSTGSVKTRAVGGEFAENDKLLSYIRHLNENNVSINADQAPKLVTFTTSATGSSVSSPNLGTTLYWDDFSNSATAETDLRTANHGLQSYYGYCYNGGGDTHITTGLNQENGTLGWTLPTSYASATDVQRADLLWSRAQEKVTYDHSNARDGSRAGLTIPYSHAMSEITVTLKAEEGFSGNPLTSTVLTLNNMNTVASLSAPTATVTSTTSSNITMFAENYAGGMQRNFTAIVAPGTRLTQGTELLVIDNVDDNKYTLTITAAMLDDETGWAKDHTADNPVQKGTDGSGNKYVITQPGVNYHLNVTVNKTAIQTHATLAEWKTLNASGTGDIKYPNDETNDLLVMDDSETPNQSGISVVAVDKNKFSGSPASSFSLFKLEANDATSSSSSRTNEAYTFATVSTFQDNEGESNDQWNNSPAIYWPNQSTNYYFRALAKFNSVTGGVNNISYVGTYNSDKGTGVSQGTIGDGHDILWGTTAKHKGTKDPDNPTIYGRGQAIPPRTGDVPIAFEHAMSMVTFQLKTTEGAVSDNSPAVNLEGATIAVSNLYTKGTINIENGNIDHEGNRVENAIAATTAPITELVVIPQGISDNAKVTVTLSDGTIYSLQLNKCKDDDTSETITTWERGKHYTYTISLKKEQIEFRALVKKWEEHQGSGNANLEWDD